MVGHSALSPLVASADGPLTNALKVLGRGTVHPRADEWQGGVGDPMWSPGCPQIVPRLTQGFPQIVPVLSTC